MDSQSFVKGKSSGWIAGQSLTANDALSLTLPNVAKTAPAKLNGRSSLFELRASVRTARTSPIASAGTNLARTTQRRERANYLWGSLPGNGSQNATHRD